MNYDSSIVQLIEVRATAIDVEFQRKYKQRVERVERKLHDRLAECAKNHTVVECRNNLKHMWFAQDPSLNSLEAYRCINEAYTARTSNMNAAVNDCFDKVQRKLFTTIEAELSRLEAL